MKILFLTQISPYPPSNGGAIKTYNILKGLGSKHDIRLLMFIRRDEELDSIPHLSTFCRSVHTCMIKRSGAKNILHAVHSILTNNSFIITRDSHPGMKEKIIDLLEWKPDIIYADHLQMFQFVPQPAPCPVVLDNHNVEWRIIERFASTARSPAQRIFASSEWKRLRDYEINACKTAGLVLTVTAQDREILESNGVPSGKVLDLPIGVDTERFKQIDLQPESSKILSIGTMSWPPNIDSINYFISTIYPMIRREKPDTTFTIAGANPPAEIVSIGQKDKSVNVTGYIDDIMTVAEDTAVFVVPLRIGSGMRVKILDAMALGLPIVTTSIGCEGIAVNDGEHLLMADTPDDFAKSVLRILHDPSLRSRLGTAGRSLVEQQYSWPPIIDKLDKAISNLR
ncbi:MAG: glycosyltransferase family 4 protein [Armatimonadota bacterium]